MATLSLFYGILITMRPEEGARHKKPHLHARHAGRQASFDISSTTLKALDVTGTGAGWYMTAAAPEPTSGLLLLLGVAGLALKRKRA